MAHQEGTVGICCSGGGIRSAAFNLGALQVLQETRRHPDDQNVLHGAKWLAAVSGGSYIAGAFTMVQRSIQDRRQAVEAKIAECTKAASGPDGELTQLTREREQWEGASDPFAVGSPEVDLLRNHSRYIAPDAYHVVEIFLRLLLGLLINLLVVASILATIGIAAGLLLGSVSHPLVANRHVYGRGTTAWLVSITLVVVAAGVVVFGTNVLVRWPDTVRKVTSAVGIILIGLGAGFAFGALLVPWLVLQVRQGVDLGFLGTLRPGSLTGATGVGAAAVGVGVGAQSKSLVSQVEALAKATGRELTAFQKLSQGLRKIVVTVVGTLVVPLLALGALVLLVEFGVSRVEWKSSAGHLTHAVNASGVWALVGAVAVGLVLYRFGNLTTWSLHPYYRRRLSDAYALERTSPSTAAPRPYDPPVTLSTVQPDDFPTLLVCATANVTDPEVTPPGQNGVSFVFSSADIGYRVRGHRATPLDGWVSTDAFEKWVGKHDVDVTLPAAIAMSGAALSPEMGNMTRSWLRALMALGNIRLGVWLPNPDRMQHSRRDTLPSGAGRARVHHLLAELLGINHIRRRFLYITDGGHWDNLGLVELLRRRCDVIWCFDAAGDKNAKFHTLGQALAVAGAEQGVAVDIQPDQHISIVTDADIPATCTANHALGTITYPATSDGPQKTGLLIYVRASTTAEDPWAVRGYADTSKTFPGDSTINQLFDYRHFDAYHLLGRTAAKAAWDNAVRINP